MLAGHRSCPVLAGMFCDGCWNYRALVEQLLELAHVADVSERKRIQNVAS